MLNKRVSLPTETQNKIEFQIPQGEDVLQEG